MNDAAAPSAQLGLLEEKGHEYAAWRVRASNRARRLTVRVFPGGQVEIVVPNGTRPRAVERFVSRHRSWIVRKVAQYQSVEPVEGDSLPEVIQFQASGDRWQVEYVEASGTPRLMVADARIRLIGDQSRVLLLRHALQRFTMRAAHAILIPQLELLASEYGLQYASAQIRRQRTRWGSCSRHGTISLNACLVFQPAAVVRYLLLHELAHTRHMNHSRRFWELVARLEPRWREMDAALTGGWREVPAWALR